MILDRLENADMYRGLEPRIVAALDYLRRADFSQLTDGRHELDGDRLFAIVQRYRTRPLADSLWETHRRYVDVQYLVAGTERMGFASLTPETPVRQPYDEAKDVAFYDAQGDCFDVRAGSFVVFAPHDVHAPGLAAGSPPVPAEVFKVVVKCLRQTHS